MSTRWPVSDRYRTSLCVPGLLRLRFRRRSVRLHVAALEQVGQRRHFAAHEGAIVSRAAADDDGAQVIYLLRDVGFLVDREHPTEGTIRDIRQANHVSIGERADWLPAPLLGEQTEEILREAGFTEAEIEAMIAEGAARCAQRAGD